MLQGLVAEQEQKQQSLKAVPGRRLQTLELGVTGTQLELEVTGAQQELRLLQLSRDRESLELSGSQGAL